MNSNTQNAKIEAITEKTLVIGIDVGSETHYARAFDHRGFEYSKKAFQFSNDEAGFESLQEWILDIKDCLLYTSKVHLWMEISAGCPNRGRRSLTKMDRPRTVSYTHLISFKTNC